MRKVSVGLLVLGLMLAVSQVYGGETADITVYVKISQLSVAVNPTSYDFGTMVANTNAVASSYIAVTNDGNVTEKFKLGIPSEPNGTWTSVTAAAPGSEEYRLSAIFKDAQPSTYGAEDSFSASTERTASTTELAETGGNEGEKGYSVNQDDWRKLWFKFEAPSDTVITTQQSITARVTALAQ